MKKVLLTSAATMFAVGITSGAFAVQTASQTIVSGAADAGTIASKAYVDRYTGDLYNYKAALESTGTSGEIATVGSDGQYVRSGTTIADLQPSLTAGNGIDATDLANDIVTAVGNTAKGITVTASGIEAKVAPTTGSIDYDTSGNLKVLIDDTSVKRNATTGALEVNVSQVVQGSDTIDITGGVVSVIPDGTKGIAIGTGGVEAKIDNDTIIYNTSGQLEADGEAIINNVVTNNPTFLRNLAAPVDAVTAEYDAAGNIAAKGPVNPSTNARESCATYIARLNTANGTSWSTTSHGCNMNWDETAKAGEGAFVWQVYVK